MQTPYTPEEIRTLLAEDLPLEYASPTDADVVDAADVLEGVEELVAKLDPAVRRDELLISGRPVGEHLWVPAVTNCSRAVGIAIDPDGALSFMVTGHEFGDDFPTYFSARQAVAHALLRQANSKTEASPEEPAELPAEPFAVDGDAIVAALKANGNAVAAGRTVADIDPGALAAVHALSEAGVAHLFACEAAGGVVLALAGSTEGDRRRAVENLAIPPGRSYSSRACSVLLEAGETSGHYSEESWFGQSVKEAPKPERRELDDAGERFRSAHFVRPSRDRPLDVAAIRRRIGTGASEDTVREVAERALDAETPWDSKAERGRMQKTGARLRREILAGRKARGGGPIEVRPAAELDADRRASRPAERPAGWLEDPKLGPAVESRLKSGRAAYDTARAVYLRKLPTLAHRLLHLLRREGGAVPERDFVSRHARLAGAGAAEPEAALGAALRELADAGKVRRLRGRATGEVFLAAAEPLDEAGFRRGLNGLIRDPRSGIVNPWTRADAVEPEGEEDEEAALGRDAEDVFLEETGRQALLDTVADGGAREELEALTA